MKTKTKTKTEVAFEQYCYDPIIQQALVMTNGALNLSLLRDTFVAGAKYATQRCVAKYHH